MRSELPQVFRSLSGSELLISSSVSINRTAGMVNILLFLHKSVNFQIQPNSDICVSGFFFCFFLYCSKDSEL